MVRKCENGGIVEGGVSNTPTANAKVQQQSNAVILAILDSLDALRRQMAQPSRSYVVLGDIYNNQAQMDRIVGTATASR